MDHETVSGRLIGNENSPNPNDEKLTLFFLFSSRLSLRCTELRGSAASDLPRYYQRDSGSSEVGNVNEAEREREADVMHVGCFSLNGRGSCA